MDALLKNWSIIQSDPYKAPEQQNHLILSGIVFNHPNFSDGTLVKTSYLVDIDSDGKWAQTRTRKYNLGNMDSTFKDFMLKGGYTIHQYKVVLEAVKVARELQDKENSPIQ